MATQIATTHSHRAAEPPRLRITAADRLGRVSVFLEPIALYMTKDLHEDGDGDWLTDYPPPEETLELGSVRAYGDGTDLCIASYANGLYMSLRVAKRLEAEGHRVRVVDLLPHAEAAGSLLIVDECRRSSGIAHHLAADITERSRGAVRIGRVTGEDCYIPLGDAANRVLVQEEDIERGARALLEHA